MSADADEALRAALAAGNAHVKEHRWAGGWLVRTRQAPIVKSSEISMSDYSHGAWKRELGLTNVAGQSLPGYLFGGNALELVHEASGVRISFCALEALRSWVLEESVPVRHLSPLASPPEWDYTFTTAYPGSTTVAPVGTQPDRTSFHSRPAVDLASGQVRTRCTRPRRWPRPNLGLGMASGTQAVTQPASHLVGIRLSRGASRPRLPLPIPSAPRPVRLRLGCASRSASAAARAALHRCAG